MYLAVWLSICTYLSVCMSVCLPVCLSVCSLRAAVSSPLIDDFVAGLEQLNSPELLWKDRCDMELKPLMQSSQRNREVIAKIWQEIYTDMFDHRTWDSSHPHSTSRGQLAKKFAQVSDIMCIVPMCVCVCVCVCACAEPL